MYRFAVIAALALALSNPPVSIAEADTREVNDGQVVLERVPAIPAELATEIYRYQNTRNAIFEDWAADGEGIFISTRFGNVAQIHQVAEPGGQHPIVVLGEPEPLTHPRARLT